MADFPAQGGSSGTWGTELINFFELEHFMDGNNGGKLAVVCCDNEVVCCDNEIVTHSEYT